MSLFFKRKYFFEMYPMLSWGQHDQGERRWKETGRSIWDKQDSNMAMHPDAFIQELNTALHVAAKHGHDKVLQKILETGVDINEKNIVSGRLYSFSLLHERGFVQI